MPMTLEESIKITRLMRCQLEAELAVYEEQRRPGVLLRLEAFDNVLASAEKWAEMEKWVHHGIREEVAYRRAQEGAK